MPGSPDAASPIRSILTILLVPCAQPKVRRILRSAKYLIKAMEIAKTNPNYNFIIYNSSVHYWNIARPLMKRGSFKFLEPSLTTMCDALNAIEDSDIRWRIQLNQALVKSFDEAEKYSSAAARVSSIVLMAKQLLDNATSEKVEAHEGFLQAEENTKRIIKLIRSKTGEDDKTYEGQVEEQEEEKKSASSPRSASAPEDDEDGSSLSLEELEQQLLVSERNQTKQSAVYKEK